MRPLFKYPITLFILLATGYTQVFTYLCKLNYSYPLETQLTGVVHFRAAVNTTEKEDIYIEEEENRRISLKEYSRDYIDASFLSAYLTDHFFLRFQSYISSNKYSSCISILGSSDTLSCVLRL